MKKIFYYILAISSCIIPGCGGCGHNTNTPAATPSVCASSPAPAASVQIDTEKLYQKAKEAQQSNDFEEAAALYKKILEKNPNHHKARKRLGEIYYFTGEYEPAIREFKKALEAKPPNAAAIKSNLVLCYLAVDRPESALPLIEKDLDEYSRWESHYSFLTQANYSLYMMEKNQEKKKKIIETIKTELSEGIKETTIPYTKSMLKASLALFEGDRKKTSAELGNALKEAQQDRDRISILFLLGALEDENGNRKEALNFFRQTVESAEKTDTLDPSNLMDGIYALWIYSYYEKKPMTIRNLDSITGQLRGGIREPETEVFAGKLKEYIAAHANNNHTKALSLLKDIENSIMDESIEGDYLYDGIYKPYILKFLYTLAAEESDKADKREMKAEYEKKLKQIKSGKFPY
ncbi:MAG: tetratricopeptide repeat protein [Firmicutes bacterium]|nr:tetratricopeptide repeat protein [Bacillota bacterium]